MAGGRLGGEDCEWPMKIFSGGFHPPSHSGSSVGLPPRPPRLEAFLLFWKEVGAEGLRPGEII